MGLNLRTVFVLCSSIFMILISASMVSARSDRRLGDTDPGFYSHHITVDGVDRTYLVYVPKNYDSTRPQPLVFMLHGAGGNADNTVVQTGWDKKADEVGFLVVFGNATTITDKRVASFLLNPQIWNDGSGRAFSGKRNVDDVGYIKAVLDEMKQSYNVDQTREYVTGFSNGASMTFRAGIELADRIAAIAPVSGELWLSTDSLTRPVPMIFIIGTNDPLNPIEGGEVQLPWGVKQNYPPVAQTIDSWTKLLNCPTQGIVKMEKENGVHLTTYSSCDGQSRVAVYKIEGMGHAWPGGKSFMPARIIGQPSDAIKATDVIWGFLSQYSLKK
jgi:polyhydroxybutyrate depolymerase